MPATAAATATPFISRPEGVEAFENAAGSGICSGATASREHNSAAARSPSKTRPRGFGFKGRTGISDARLEGAAPTSLAVSCVGAFFGGSLFGLAFNSLSSSDRTGAPMIPPPHLGSPCPLSLRVRCIEPLLQLLYRKNCVSQKIVFTKTRLPGVDYGHTGTRSQPQAVERAEVCAGDRACRRRNRDGPRFYW